MRRQHTYRLFAILTLVAFVCSMGVRGLHHHTPVVAADIVCALDGESLQHAESHHHNSLLPQLQQADDCPICSFQWQTEIQPTAGFTYYIPFFYKHITAENTPAFFGANILKLSSRAPPCFS